MKRKQIIVLPLLLLLIVALAGSTLANKQPWLGIFMQDVTPELVEAFDLNVEQGVLIADVVDDSPAEAAGLRQGDVIIAWNSSKVSDTDHLSDLVSDSEIGEEVTLSIIRDGKEQEIAVEIGRQTSPRSFRHFDDEIESPVLESFMSGSYTGIGVSLQSLSGDLHEYFGVKAGEGALITEVHEDSPAEEAGLKAGDVIIEVDGETISHVGDVADLIQDKDEGDKVEITIKRDRQEKEFSMEVAEMESFGSNFDINIKGLPYGDNYRKFIWKGQMPDLRSFDHYLDDRKGYEKEMTHLERKLRQLEKKLQELEEKLD